MIIPDHIRSIAPPLIDVLNAQAAALRSEGKDVISLGQAVPGFPPPDAFVQGVGSALADPDVHLYSADAGVAGLRRVLAARLFETAGIGIDPDSGMIITAGANQAFMLALQTLLTSGDEVLLPSPFYLNHEMAVRIAGAKPVEVPLSAEDAFDITLERLVPHVTPRTRILVIVNPNNPTGAVYRESELRRIAAYCAGKNITIISDETYLHFVYGKKHFSLGSLDGALEKLVLIGSLSKSFAITGWRIGFLASSAAFVKEAIKVQDSMVICATVASQMAAWRAVESSWDYPQTFLPSLQERRGMLRENLEGIGRLSWNTTDGGFFAFVHVDSCEDVSAFASDLLEKVHVVVIPGTVFGIAGRGFIRISYGSVSAPRLTEACSRIADYCSHFL